MPEEIYKRFRTMARLKFGDKKGYLSMANTEAVMIWLFFQELFTKAYPHNTTEQNKKIFLELLVKFENEILNENVTSQTLRENKYLQPVEDISLRRK